MVFLYGQVNVAGRARAEVVVIAKIQQDEYRLNED